MIQSKNTYEGEGGGEIKRMNIGGSRQREEEACARTLNA